MLYYYQKVKEQVMERTNKNTKSQLTIHQLQKDVSQLGVYVSTLVARDRLFTSLGLQYNGNRDIYKALGYSKVSPTFDKYLEEYQRHDIAKAVIDRPVKKTWQGPLYLVESSVSEDTKFETEWKHLNRKLGIQNKLCQLDRLTCIGRYGILLLGLSDTKLEEDYAKPASNNSKLIFIRPFGEGNAQITEWENDIRNPRYGLPLYYTLQTSNTAGEPSKSIKVHHSRCIHVTFEPLESEVYGTPVLESIYNRLNDLDKIVGGSAEMFWRGARPGYQGVIDKDFSMPTAVKDDAYNQIEEYEQGLRRMLLNKGYEWKGLETQVSTPKDHVDVIISMISADKGIPKRILMGSERGELASTQDSEEWNDLIQARREDHAEPNILRKFVDRLIELKILPLPKEDYDVQWSDLYAMSEKARVDVGKARANALREYLYSPFAMDIIPPKVFIEKFLGLSQEDVTLINSMRDDMISEEELNDQIIKSVEKSISTKSTDNTPKDKE